MPGLGGEVRQSDVAPRQYQDRLDSDEVDLPAEWALRETEDHAGGAGAACRSKNPSLLPMNAVKGKSQIRINKPLSLRSGPYGRRAVKAWHAITPEDALKELGSSTEGLSQDEAAERLKRYGENVMVGEGGHSFVDIVLDQMKNPFVPILAVATIISFFESTVDGALILFVVLLLVVTGIVIEYNSERTLQSLKKLVSRQARVLRSKQETLVDAKELVPGDIVKLGAGDMVPADVRLLKSTRLRTDESSLTGESVPVDKDWKALVEESAPIYERSNMVFSGTLVSSGTCLGLVVQTGRSSELGKISALIEKARGATPLERRVEKLSVQISAVFVALIMVYFIYDYVFLGSDLLETLLVAATLAVAAVPEGLPASVAILLAMGAKRMASRKALVRKLTAVEALGSCAVVCCDKTGTLTKNELKLVRIQTFGDSAVASEGDFLRASAFAKLLTVGVLCNDASYAYGEGIGDAVDVALLKFAASNGMDVQKVRSRYPRRAEQPFDATLKLMITTNALDDHDLVCVKGAPEAVIRKCDSVEMPEGTGAIGEDVRLRILDYERQFGEDGLKTIALAYSAGGGGLTFLGLAGFLDEEREGAADAIRKLHEAGVQVVMITGDSASTAKAIASRLGIYTGTENIISGAELGKLSPDELAKELPRTVVFCRTTPEQKLSILEGYKRAGIFVAMTGDGVNDAPALKAANVGVAMGERGTEVAKETADLVLLDDNISTVAAAVEEGRGIFNNIRKAVTLLLAANLAEIAIVTITGFAGLPTPLLPVHLLWINLVTDIIPVLPLAGDPPAPGLMKAAPLRVKDSIVSAKAWLAIILTSIYFSAAGIFLFYYELPFGEPSARGVVFTLIVTAELFMVLMFRAFYDRAWQTNRPLLFSLIFVFLLQVAVTEIPSVSGLFKIDGLLPYQWLQLLVLCLPIVAATVYFAFGKRFKKAAP